jgi:aromatic ring-opening dioxygenase catalytic subunit (LigB family)
MTSSTVSCYHIHSNSLLSSLQEPQPTVNTAAKPELLYDYYGFPPESYKVTYPANGAPQIAQRVVDLLR